MSTFAVLSVNSANDEAIALCESGLLCESGMDSCDGGNQEQRNTSFALREYGLTILKELHSTHVKLYQQELERIQKTIR